MFQCKKCEGISFKEKRYKPEDYFVGRPSSETWIVGLNPGKRKQPTKKDLNNYFKNKDTQPDTIASYFRDFQIVSRRLWDLLGGKKGAGFTDIVKCCSKKFPPKKCRLKSKKIIENCKVYLEKQLKRNTPKLIICNGRSVCDLIQKIIKPPLKDNEKKLKTHYSGKFQNKKVTVILSGFIGRIDNYAKRRLGMEIDKFI